MRKWLDALLLFFPVATFAGLAPQHVAAELRVSPLQIVLHSPESSQQLLVSETGADGQSIDLTRSVEYELTPAGIAKIDEHGLIRPLADGQAELRIQREKQQLTVPIQVGAFTAPAPVSFQNEVIPILTKAGCNSGGCHGKAEGQNGFKLSIFGFDPASDYDALVKESRGRRIFLASPQQSLLFRKASARIPHGGGQKIDPGS